MQSAFVVFLPFSLLYRFSNRSFENKTFLVKLVGLLWPSTTWLIMNLLFYFQATKTQTKTKPNQTDPNIGNPNQF